MTRLLILPLCTLLLGSTLSGFNNVESIARPVEAEISYPEHLTGTFTGGFGEETCRSCHFDYDLNPEDAKLTISGIENVSGGEMVEIQITVERETLGAAGFQLSARYEDGSQAGQFMIEKNDRIMFTDAAADSLQYVQHTSKGTTPSQENKTSWTIKWQAPESEQGTIILNIAANAANGDMSEFGDFIYTEEVKVELPIAK